MLQEHWLWPFEEDFLRDINKDYSYCSIFDARLHSESTLQRGCGGISILRRKNLNASPIPNLSSDRICGIHLSLSNNLALHVIGTYMPSSDQSREAYVNCLNEVDLLLSQLPSNDPIVVMGDLNCHLGHFLVAPIHRGVLWKELLDRHSLFVASLGALSTGQIHTHSSGDHSTTPDYVIGNVALAEMLQSCERRQKGILHARVLCSKFSFLLKVTQGDNSLSCQVFRSLAASEVESIQLVHQCWFLESQYGSNLTSDILTDPMSFSTAALKKDILWLDRSRLIADASTVPHLKHIVDVDTDHLTPMARLVPWLC